MRLNKSQDPPLLIDTHVWLWLMNGDLETKYSNVYGTIEKYLKRDAVRISAISVWEVAMLVSKRRITLPTDCMAWVRRSLTAPGVEMEELSPEIAVVSTRLPGGGPSDPSDQIILATAMSLGAVLATRDQEIISYCEKHELPCLAF